MLAANYIFASYGTTGLETMFAALALTLAFERAHSGAPLAAGLAGVASIMAHPDHALFYAALGAALFLDPERRRGVPRFVLPALIVFLPYWLLRWHYYGDFFPNTYYAKNAGEAYFSQGAAYLWISGLGAGLWAALPLALYGGLRRPGALLTRWMAIAVPIYGVYVAKIGGDYMYGRLLVPLLPPLTLLAEQGARDLLARSSRWAMPALAGLAAVAVPARVIAPAALRWGMSDERTWMPLASLYPLRVDSDIAKAAEFLRTHFVDHGLKPVVAEYRIGLIAYATGLPVIDCHGLTDRAIAHQPLPERGRPGHERRASPEYLLSRGVDVSVVPLYPEPQAALTRFRPGSRYFYHLAHWDPALVAPLLADPGTRLVDFPIFLDAYGTRAEAKDRRASDLAFFDAYYFSRNPDPARRALLSNRLE